MMIQVTDITVPNISHVEIDEQGLIIGQYQSDGISLLDDELMDKLLHLMRTNLEKNRRMTEFYEERCLRVCSKRINFQIRCGS